MLPQIVKKSSCSRMCDNGIRLHMTSQQFVFKIYFSRCKNKSENAGLTWLELLERVNIMG